MILQEMIKARTELIIKHPFFGKLAIGMKIVERDDIDTMAVDGTHLFYNKKWVLSITHKERVGVIAHEVLHIVFKHHLRRKDRCHHYWNVAGDYVINAILFEHGFILPDGGLFDARYVNQKTETVYNQVFKDKEHDGYKMVGEVIDATGNDGEELKETELKEMEKEINVQVLQAEQSAKSMGKGGDATKGMLDIVKEQSVSWEDVLANLILDKVDSDDYNFNNVNRRFIHQNLYLPSVEKKPSAKGVLAIDISGSTSKEDQAMYISCANDIKQIADFDELTIIYCDDAVRRVDTFEKGEDIELHYMKGGGTDYEPVIKYIDKELDNDISFLVYLTDGYCYACSEPDYPVVWATTMTSRYFKFGDIVEVA
mgnify:CR=1 FL=1